MLTRKSPTRFGGLVIALVAISALGGCFAFDPPVGGAALQRHGDSVRIAVCVSIADASGRVSFRQLEVANEWVEAWAFDSGGDLGPGSIISGEGGAVPIVPDTEIEVRIKSAKGGDGEVDAGFVVPSSGLSEESWLQMDGSESAEPCPT